MKRVLWVLLILNSLAGMAMAQVGHITLTPGSAISASAMQTYLNTLADAINSLVLVGTVIASTLTKDQMNTLYPDGMWVLADGTAAPNPSAYRTNIAATLPDLRGVFLRGKNHTRSDGKEDPAGDQAIGTYQADQLQNHMHNWLPLTIPGAFEAMDIPEASSYAPRGGSLYGVFNGAWTGESQVTNYRPHVGSVTTSGSWDTGMGPLVLARAGAE